MDAGDFLQPLRIRDYLGIAELLRNFLRTWLQQRLVFQALRFTGRDLRQGWSWEIGDLDNFSVFALEAFYPPGCINKFLFTSKERMAV